MKKVGIVLLWALLFALLMTFSAFAADDDLGVKIPEREWEDFYSTLPPEVEDRLPDGTLDGSDGFAENVSKMSSGEYIAYVISDVLGVGIGDSAKLFLALLGVLSLSAVMGAVGQGFENQGLVSAMRFCSSAALMSVIIYSLYSHFSLLEDFLRSFG